MKEVWKTITGYEDYQVSNLGRVKSLKYGKERILTDRDTKGYLYITVSKNSIRKRLLIHRLVAEAFLDNPDNLPIINHRDENKHNNKADNLEFCTYYYNLTYNNKHRTYAKKVGCFKDGKLLKVYMAIQDVKNDGFDASNVCNCCKGKLNKHHGYQWTYIN